KLIGKKQLRLSISTDDTEADIYASVIKQFYDEMVEIPDEILISTEPPEADLILEWLKKKAEKKVVFHYPKRGDLSSLLKLCHENAVLQLKDIQLQRMKKEGNLPYPVKALQRDLRLKTLPRKIECFDISNLQGTDTVASMVVFVEGKPKKSLYRKFIIRTTEGEPDDFASMFEVITRRYKRLKEEGGKLPDLIMVDGGKGQLSSAVQALRKLDYENFSIIGLAKRLEEVFFPGEAEPENIPKVSSGLKLLQQVRDEAHRFAITFHRERRSKRTFTSELNEIKGIGKAVVAKLLTHFGSINEIRRADMERLIPVVGEKRANLIIRHYNEHPELLEESDVRGQELNSEPELPPAD
ncbi:MAG: excinuclease ABC subunit C, partial [Ignavibacteriaceae bacterium]|nr:excinuclease ABC subunit C [Ignavibacteriaceae bacterium]